MVKILSAYPVEIVRKVTSIETGLQRTCKFPPRTAELVAACDALVAHEANINRLRNWGTPEFPEERSTEPRVTKEQLEERYGGSLLPSGFGVSRVVEPPGFKTGQALAWEPLIEHYKDHPERVMGLTQSQGARRSHRSMDIPPPRRMREFGV